jgi:1-phosphofructokinase family hexose kinase
MTHLICSNASSSTLLPFSLVSYWNVNLMSGPQNSRYEFDVIVLSPNVAIDSYYLLSDFKVGEVNRSERVWHTAGGKSNNMARAAVLLGGRVLSLGIVGGTSGQFIVNELARESIASDMVWTEKETRRCVTIPLTGGNQTTVVLEAGGPVGDHARQELMARALGHANRAPFLTLNGSLPPDFPDDFYAVIIQELRDKPVQICLDSAGASLKQAAQAGPSIIKVNLQEFRSVFVETQEWDWLLVLEIFSQLSEKGLELLVITNGAQGAYVFARDVEPFRVFTPVDAWVSTAGAGDTFLAGLVLSLGRGKTLKQAASFAAAAAAATLQHVVCGSLELSDVESYLGLTRAEQLFDRKVQ